MTVTDSLSQYPVAGADNCFIKNTSTPPKRSHLVQFTRNARKMTPLILTGLMGFGAAWLITSYKPLVINQKCLKENTSLKKEISILKTKLVNTINNAQEILKNKESRFTFEVLPEISELTNKIQSLEKQKADLTKEIKSQEEIFNNLQEKILEYEAISKEKSNIIKERTFYAIGGSVGLVVFAIATAFLGCMKRAG